MEDAIGDAIGLELRATLTDIRGLVVPYEAAIWFSRPDGSQ